jgi:flagellar assembly protein FliH
LSENKNRQSFEASPWGAVNRAKPNAGAAADDGRGFKALYSKKEKESKEPEEFVASFVSEEKARALAKTKAPVNADRLDREPLEDIERRAYEKAFSQGRQAGLEDGRKKTQEIIDQLQGILTDVEAAWTNLIQTHEARIIELVFRVVEKVVYGQAVVEQEMVKRVIVEALQIVPEPVNVEIYVNPGDYEYIETVKEDFFSHIKALKDVSVTSDPSIHPGGCNVKTKFGEVDATLENRLEAVRECLLKANGRKT